MSTKPAVRVAACCLLLVIVFLVAGCVTSVETPTPVFLEAGGATSMTPLMESLSAAYGDRHPGVDIYVTGGGSELGQSKTLAGELDIGLSCWLPDGAPDGLQATVVARDGIAVIVHPSNVMTAITTIQLQQVFAGRMSNWQDFGGPDMPIQVVSRENGSGTRSAFEAQLMQERRVTPTALVMPNSQAVVDFVAEEPQAIGYVSMGYIDLSPPPGSRVVPLIVEGVRLTPENVSTGAYVPGQDLFLLTASNASPEVRRLVEFVLSPAGQSVVAQHYGRVR